MSDKKSCATCSFFSQFQAKSGQCYRFPPSVFGVEKDIVTAWPTVNGKEWCGEYNRSKFAKPGE